MNKLIYRSLLGICLIFSMILGSCSLQSRNIESNQTTTPTLSIEADNSNTTAAKKTDANKSTSLPALKIDTQAYITPAGGLKNSEAKDLVVEYLVNNGVKGDVKKSLVISEITTKAAWENLKAQIYKVQLDYRSIYGVAVIKDGKLLSMINGMPVFDVFLADLDLDSQYEVYANTSFGSGIVSEDISGYNLVTNTEYYMSERMKKDFKLFIKDNTLMVKEYLYGNSHKDFDTSPEIKDIKLKNDKLILETPKYGFAIYKVKYERTPLITERDIKKYIWKSNIIVFNDDFLKEHVLSKEEIKLVTEKNKSIESDISLSFYGGSKHLKCSDAEDVLVVVGEDRIYTSGFALPAWSSRWSPQIYIEDYDLTSIRIRSPKDLESLIQDKRIYEFFKKIGKLDF